MGSSSSAPAIDGGPLNDRELAALRARFAAATGSEKKGALLSYDAFCTLPLLDEAKAVHDGLHSRLWAAVYAKHAAPDGKLALQPFVTATASAARGRSSGAVKLLWELAGAPASGGASVEQQADVLRLLQRAYCFLYQRSESKREEDGKRPPEEGKEEAAGSDAAGAGDLSALLASLAAASAAYRKRQQLKYGRDAPEVPAVDSLPRAAFVTWAESRLPSLYRVVEDAIAASLLGSAADELRLCAGSFTDGAKSQLLTATTLMALCLAERSLQQPLQRLYASSEDGLSFNRLVHHLFGYAGGTLLVLRSSSGEVFGAYASGAWREQKEFFGSGDCFLFTLSPAFTLLRPEGGGRNFQYINTSSASAPHALALGGSKDAFRLALDEDLEQCIARPSGLTFADGQLTATEEGTFRFEPEAIELWGAGGEEAAAAQRAARVAKKAARDKARKVDRAAFATDFDSEFLMGKTFAHRKGQAREDV
eukprot:PLAT9591.1.p1 GENE.PLAT9591.1~~PLAT9591.1.p1  ORF type:complete len:495 (+),score=241.22 PLAT9591.1:48-1487(+)